MSIEKTKLLLVDDLKENLVALDSLLRSEQVEIFRAPSGQAALELLLVHEFALALVDVQMPEMNGFELAELMRGASRTKNIPIIFVTAGAINSQNTFKGYETGAVDFLYKPLDPHIVRSKVSVFVELDIQRKLLKDQLRETRDALSLAEKAVRTRDDFLAIASHELRTPLTSLNLQIQMLARIFTKAGNGNLPKEKFQRGFEVSISQLKNLDKLIGALLDVARISNGKFSLETEIFNLRDLVKETLDQFAEQFRAAKCELKVELSPEVIGRWDRQRTMQVISNLFANAVKYGAGTLVEVTLKATDGYAELTVKDRGIGISKPDQVKIFDRFERAATEKTIGGLGLGLHIVREIVLAHRGEIKLESELGQGATFTVRFPL